VKNGRSSSGLCAEDEVDLLRATPRLHGFTPCLLPEVRTWSSAVLPLHEQPLQGRNRATEELERSSSVAHRWPAGDERARQEPRSVACRVGKGSSCFSPPPPVRIELGAATSPDPPLMTYDGSSWSPGGPPAVPSAACTVGCCGRRGKALIVRRPAACRR